LSTCCESNEKCSLCYKLSKQRKLKNQRKLNFVSIFLIIWQPLQKNRTVYRKLQPKRKWEGSCILTVKIAIAFKNLNTNHLFFRNVMATELFDVYQCPSASHWLLKEWRNIHCFLKPFSKSQNVSCEKMNISIGNSMASSAIWRKKSMHEWVFQRLLR
jgi:hypothetical protein